MPKIGRYYAIERNGVIVKSSPLTIPPTKNFHTRRDFDAKTKIKALIGMGAAIGAAGLVFATPIVGLISPIISSGVDSRPIDSRGVAATTDGRYYNISLKSDGPSSVATQEASYAVGGRNGWHAHPGLVVVTMQAGTIEWNNAHCETTTYTAGDSWTEGSQLHYFKNIGKGNVLLTATFIVAKGEPLRTDEPAPACAAALGLD